MARPHAAANDPYFFGAMKPVADFASHKPSDCSKFASCCVYGATGIIYGCDNNRAEPLHAYGGTIYWHRDALALGIMIAVEQAAAIPGAAVLRFVEGEPCHHIVLSDGQGGTIEAASTRLGVICDTLHGRRWSTGILVPGVDYGPLPAVLPVQPPAGVVYRLTAPLMRGQKVFEIQCRLNHLGYLADDQTDWVYGPKTAAAVLNFQRAHGLVADGEVGPRTLAALTL